VLSEALTDGDAPELRLALGLLAYLDASFDDGDRQLQQAYLGFRSSGQPRRAALAATHLARLHQDGTGNTAVASGWLGRAERLLGAEGDCVERGWALLPFTGCNIVDADELADRSEQALDLARRFDDVDLECKALADFGLALMLHGRIGPGQSLIDEAMTMAHSGECDNGFITAQIHCCVVSACERTGDLARLEEWLVLMTAAEPHMLGPNARPNLLLAHCHSQFGTLLCQAGRWPEAEAALRRATQAAESIHFHMRAQSRAGLALLRIEQGRLAEAADLLDGYEQRWEAQHTLVRLHYARGDHDLAVAVARQALRALGTDHLRRPPLLTVLVDAELARGNIEGAREAVEALVASAAKAPQPAVQALALRAQALLAGPAGDTTRAKELLEEALTTLPGDHWPLLAADLHLQLARTTAATDRTLAITEARRALAALSRLGAHQMREAQELLHSLGDPIAAGPLLPERLGKLTVREREILRLVAEGLSNPQIAQRLVISPKTAEHHVGAILRKLQLSSRSEAAVYAATLS
jgi:DNA-binding NarL/FixJ family response regulator